MMKHESSPSAAVGPAASMSMVDQHERSGEQDFSDDEPENEAEALQHLPPEERRKALRRLRNRESARRVRARRLAEMSQMETTVHGVQEENTALKAHVGKLQQHVQQMTLKVYEVTAKYESAVAENAQLRAELQHLRRSSVPGESGFTGLAAPQAGLGAGACASGPTSAAPVGVSPFVAPMETQSAPLPQLASHAALRASSPMDLSHQRQALDEVVQLLNSHKHRGTATDRSGCSDMASNAPTANPAPPSAAHPTSNSPGCDSVPVYGAGVNLGQSALFARGSASEASLLSHLAAQQQQHHQSALGLSQSLSPAQMAALNAQQQQQQQGPQHGVSGLSGPMAALSAGGLPSSGVSMPSLNPSGVQGQSPPQSFHAQQQQQQQQMSLLQQQQQQQQQELLLRQQAALHQQLQYQMQAHQAQQQAHAHAQAQAQHAMQQGDGSGTSQGSGYLPAQQAGAYFGAQAVAAQLNAAACQPQPQSQAQPGAGLCGPSSAQPQPLTLGPSLGFGAHGSSAAAAANHRSASFAIDIRARGFCTGAVPSGVGSLAPSWHTAGYNAAGAAGVAMLRPEDITEDLFMSLEAYEPVQDL